MFLTQSQQSTLAAFSPKHSELAFKSSSKVPHLGVKEKFYKIGTNTDDKGIGHEKKWKKIVDIYNFNNHSFIPPRHKTVGPGFAFYRLMCNNQLLQKYQLTIKMPETFMQYGGELIFLRNNQQGILQAISLQREDYTDILQQLIKEHSEKLCSETSKHKPHYNPLVNTSAPVLITKTEAQYNDRFDIEVQSYKSFEERRSRPTPSKIVQRYVYSRNMKAMVVRVHYQAQQRGEQRQQFYIERFQNTDDIFRLGRKDSNIYETVKYQAIVSASIERQNKIQYSKITNMKGLQKFIQPSKELLYFLSHSQQIKIDKMTVDFLVDPFNVVLLINMKHIVYKPFPSTRSLSRSSFQGGHVRSSSQHLDIFKHCRLCSMQYHRKQMTNSVSNKMIVDFVKHLEKRLTIEQFQKVKFLRDVGNMKIADYVTEKVCDQCYTMVAEQFKLIEQEQKLAKICNIDRTRFQNLGQNQTVQTPTNHKQWRLMLYFSSVSNFPHGFLSTSGSITLKYSLGNGIEQSWKVKAKEKTNHNNKGKMSLEFGLKVVTIHYLYANEQELDAFLANSEITVEIGVQDDKVFAKGSSNILASFSRLTNTNMCLRQTSSLLLFYAVGKYCEMTIKTGLVYDGIYKTPKSTNLQNIDGILFAHSGFVNSNPMPRQWMEAFGATDEELNYNEEIENIVNFGIGKFMALHIANSKQIDKKDRKRYFRRSLQY